MTNFTESGRATDTLGVVVPPVTLPDTEMVLFKVPSALLLTRTDKREVPQEVTKASISERMVNLVAIEYTGES